MGRATTPAERQASGEDVPREKGEEGEKTLKTVAAAPASPAGGSASTSAGGSASPRRSEAARRPSRWSPEVPSPAAKRGSSPSPRSPSPPPYRDPEIKYDHRRTNGEVLRCKKGKRSDIKNTEWGKFGYASKEEVLTREIVYDEQTVPIRRVKRADITPEWFIENIASQSEPIIVEDCCSHWPAMDRWSMEALEERFRHVAFKVAKDDKGKKLRTKFKYYADYVRHQQDDNPLYLFETNIDDNGCVRPLIEDFEVPDIFPHDWLGLVNSDSRPPYRWFCIGPKRSGTTVHIDPLGTAAWNAVTHGKKRWVLFDPKEAKKVVKGKDLIKDGEDDEAIMYFDYILPRIKKEHPELKVYEGLQGPGEVIFVPGDWWHGVLNLEDTVAVTQNYCGPDNFDLVWKKTRKEREKVAYLWLRNMRRYAPDLHERALAMNREDKFRMRHERPAGERLSDASSSSSESSSDSSSDLPEDLDPLGLQAAVGRAAPALGGEAFKLQGSPLPRTSWEGSLRPYQKLLRDGSAKRRRVEEEKDA